GGVVDRTHADGVRADAGGAAGEQAVGAGVADGGDDDDTLAGQCVGGAGGRVLGPGGEGRADGQVDHVHLVLERHLHRLEHDRSSGGAPAAEDAVGADGGVGSHTHDLATGGGDPGHVGAVALAVVGV